MNLQQVRLANTSHMLVQNCAGARVNPNGYAKNESLRSTQDVDLQMDEGVVTVPKGTLARVEDHNSQQVLLNLGEQLGKFVLDLGVVGKYFEKVTPKTEALQVARRVRQQVSESNPLVATPGAYVEVTGYDPKIGPNRGPKSPGFGGYQTLVGQKGQIATLYNLNVPGVMTYKVQLEKGGEFILGDTEFKVIRGVGTQESVESNKPQEVDTTALMGLGFGL
jgi:hypothetical protein